MAAPIIQFKRGGYTSLPGLRAGEPAFTTDKYDLFVGLTSSTTTNQFFGSARYWVREDGNNSAQLKLVDKGGSNYISLKSPNTLSGVGTYTFPDTSTIGDNYFLKVSIGGTLSWSAISGSSYAATAGVATYATSAGIATYATTAGVATYAGTSGVSTTSGYATSAGIATYAISSGIATYATTAGISTYATNAGIATYATNAGVATYAGTSGVSTTSGYATNAGVATYATSSGIATYATNAGVATYAGTSGVSTVANNLTGSPNITVSSVTSSGVVTATQFVSTVATGTAPISVASSTLVSNLNAQYLNGQPGSYYQIANNLTGTAPGSVITSASSNFNIGGDLFVTGSLSVGGTTAILNAAQLQVKDKDIVVGITTDANNDDISNDNTANHGGIAVASTVGSPIINIPIQAGINSNPSTYKQFMWIKQGNYSGMGTDAWVSNYAISIGNTSTVVNGSRLTVGAGFTAYDNLLYVVNHTGVGINVTGVVTASSFSGNASSATYATSAGISTYATSAGIATYATNAGVATYAGTSGVSTTSGYATNAGVSTYATSAGIATYSTNAGVATYATSAGIATYATNAGVATYAGTSGVSTTSGYATSAGIATYATNAGVATYATSSGIATYTTTAGIATYATNAGVATYAGTSGVSTTSGYATNAGVATYATNAGVATYATNAGIATRANVVDTTSAPTTTLYPGLFISGAGTASTAVYVSTGMSFSTATNTLLVANAQHSTIKASDGTSAISINNTTGNVGIASDLTISGSLYIAGNTVQVNTTSLQVEDRIIELGKLATNSTPPSDTTWDLGILFNYYTASSNKKASVYWEHGVQRFLFASDVSESVLGINLPDSGAVGLGTTTPQLTSPTFAPIEVSALWANDSAGSSVVVSYLAADGLFTGSSAGRYLQNIIVDAGTF